MDARLIAFERLLNIMDDLREKCPWDQKQTLDSLRHLTIEETYELADAIIDKDLDALKGEIGDLFLHMVFYCKIGSEHGAFDVTSVLNAICDKLVHRHPHIYGDVKAETEEEAQEIEALAAGLKAYATNFTTATLQECREACGGKGYLSENRIDALKNDTEIYTTFEGDNTVLMQLVAKNTGCMLPGPQGSKASRIWSIRAK